MTKMIEVQATCLGKRNTPRTLLWEEGNKPCPKVVLFWFAHFFGGRNWKIILERRYRRDEYKRSY